jgi:tetratricopeptide (TPR) repeat protein
MILTNCAACAAPLGLSLGKKCGRCSTRYCGPACQKQHWDAGGHNELCKRIKKSGGAELFHADKKLKEAIAEAVEACADDTRGQTCFICTQALHWKTKEGLVRGCSCRGTAGFAHVSCLAEQAKILVAEAEENNLSHKTWNERWFRWYNCSLCEQQYHGVVYCALGWACWKTYVGRPETDVARQYAMNLLAGGLYATNNYEDALSVMEAQLPMMRRLGDSAHNILALQSNLANTYQGLRRLEQAMLLKGKVYSGYSKLYGEQHEHTLVAADNYAMALLELRRFEEAKRLLRKVAPVAQRVLGNDHELTLSVRENLCLATLDGESPAEEKRDALKMFEDTLGVMQRVLGPQHPDTQRCQRNLHSYNLEEVRKKLASFDT